MSAADLEIGQEVKLGVRGGDGQLLNFHGFVFCVDKETDVIVLEEPHPQSILKQDVRILKLSLVTAVEKIGSPPQGPPEELPVVPKELLEKREAEALRKAESDLTKIGKGVSREAQILFDTLDKTYKLKWRGKEIVTELGITIKPPYTPEACIGRDANALDRMKKIIATIRQRIASGELQ